MLSKEIFLKGSVFQMRHLLLHLTILPGHIKGIDTNHHTLGSRDGAVVRALASHQFVPGSIPGPGVICELSLLLVLFLAPRGFSLVTLVFPSKTNISKFQFDLELSSNYQEPLARANAQALPVFDIKFAFTFTSHTRKLLPHLKELVKEIIKQRCVPTT